MKTPMTELLEWVRATLPMDLDTPILIEEKIELLIDKERKQIMKAFYEGMGCQGFDQNMGRAEIYYNETYNRMKLKEAIEVLRMHNKWRRGGFFVY